MNVANPFRLNGNKILPLSFQPEQADTVVGSPTGQNPVNGGAVNGAINAANTNGAAPVKLQKTSSESNEAQGLLSQFDQGHGSGCGDCVSRMGGFVSSDLMQKLRSGQASERAGALSSVKANMKAQDDAIESSVIAHENAHAAAAGGLGGGIQYDYNSRGKIVGGKVPVQMPGIDKNNPGKAVQQAQQVMSAALAPADPSGQDQSVASKAASIMSQAQTAQATKQAKEQDGKNGNPNGPQNGNQNGAQANNNNNNGPQSTKPGNGGSNVAGNGPSSTPASTPAAPVAAAPTGGAKI